MCCWGFKNFTEKGSPGTGLLFILQQLPRASVNKENIILEHKENTLVPSLTDLQERSKGIKTLISGSREFSAIHDQKNPDPQLLRGYLLQANSWLCISVCVSSDIVPGSACCEMHFFNPVSLPVQLD